MSLSASPHRAATRAYLFLAPALLVIAVVALYPLGFTLWLSFQQNIIKLPWLGTGWIGLDNYRELLFLQWMVKSSLISNQVSSILLIREVLPEMQIYQSHHRRLKGVVPPEPDWPPGPRPP